MSWHIDFEHNSESGWCVPCCNIREQRNLTTVDFEQSTYILSEWPLTHHEHILTLEEARLDNAWEAALSRSRRSSEVREPP